MIKLWLTLLSALAGPVIDNPPYQLILQESQISDSVIEETGYYRFIQKCDVGYLRATDSAWERELGILSQVNLVLKDRNCSVFYWKDGYLYVMEFNPDGEKVLEKQILANKILSSYDIEYAEDFYLAASISEYSEEILVNAKGDKELGMNDALLVRFNEDYEIVAAKVYGGILNESFLKLAISDTSLYAIGKKEPLSGGDFGFGGKFSETLLIAKIGFDLTLNHYQILSCSEPVLHTSFHKDYLYLLLEGRMYKWDGNLESAKKIIFPESMQFGARVGGNLVLCSDHNGYLYSGYDFLKLYQFEEERFTQADFVCLADAIMFRSENKNYAFDIAFTDAFFVPEVYSSLIPISKTVRSLFSDCELVEETGNPVFNPMMAGVYQITYHYKTASGMLFALEKTIEVSMTANVNEGNIYPLGYQLKFTGEAILNGKSIVNNYRIDKAGDYVLELSDVNSNTEEIRFRVDSEQIAFDQICEKNWDKEVQCGEEYALQFSFIEEGEFTVDTVTINGEITRDLILDKVNKVLSIPRTAPEDPGVYVYLIESIAYLNPNEMKSVRVNQVFTLNVLRDVPEFFVSQISPLGFEISVEDSMNCARGFEVKGVGTNFEQVFLYPISSRNLIFDTTGINQITVSLVFDVGNNENGYLPLFEATLTGSGKKDTDLGDIEILRRFDSLNQFQITFNENSGIKTIRSGNQVLFEGNNSKLWPYIAAGTLCFFGTGAITFLFKKRFFRKKSRD